MAVSDRKRSDGGEQAPEFDDDVSSSQSASASQTSDPTMYAFTEQQLVDLLIDTAKAAYRGGQYRGEFNGDKLESIGSRVVERKTCQWWERNKENYK